MPFLDGSISPSSFLVCDINTFLRSDCDGRDRLEIFEFFEDVLDPLWSFPAHMFLDGSFHRFADFSALHLICLIQSLSLLQQYFDFPFFVFNHLHFHCVVLVFQRGCWCSRCRFHSAPLPRFALLFAAAAAALSWRRLLCLQLRYFFHLLHRGFFSQSPNICQIFGHFSFIGYSFQFHSLVCFCFV